MNPLTSIDLYCERTDPSLWSEPLNALTNLAFLAAAWMLWRHNFPQPVRNEVRLFATLIALIGVGSGLFHLFGTVWGSWLDVAFIALFILIFVYRYLHSIVALPKWGCLLGVGVFLALDRVMAKFAHFGLNGSEPYLLPGATLFVLGLWVRTIAPATTKWLLTAALVFALSFTLRTLDLALCKGWPLGTHFAWHLLNAVVLYCCVRGMAAGLKSVSWNVG